MRTMIRIAQVYLCSLFAAALILVAAPSGEAAALSLSSPGSIGSAKFASESLTTEVRGHGGGHFRGGGRRFGGFHGGFRRGGFYRPHYGYRRSYRRRFYGGPAFYGYPRRCRIVYTYYGPRRICRRWHRRFYY